MRARQPDLTIDEQLGVIHVFEAVLADPRSSRRRRWRARHALAGLNARFLARLSGHPDVAWVAIPTDHHVRH